MYVNLFASVRLSPAESMLLPNIDLAVYICENHEKNLFSTTTPLCVAIIDENIQRKNVDASSRVFIFNEKGYFSKC